MNVEYTPSLFKDLKHVKDTALLRRLRQVIEGMEQARGLPDIPGLKRLHSEGRYYRLHVGDYRLGIVAEGQALVLVRFLPRKDIYRHFP